MASKGLESRKATRAAAAAQGEAELWIRPAVRADVPLVIALDEEVTGLAKPEYWRDAFDRFGARGRRERFFLVAERNGSLDGFVIGEIRAWEFGSPPCGWIFAIQVRPQSRLEGVGSELFNALCECFRKAGVAIVRTMLARDNLMILSFFRSQGMMAGPFIELETMLL
jgi:GNAT superfamily N-acetyltransferase